MDGQTAVLTGASRGVGAVLDCRAWREAIR